MKKFVYFMYATFVAITMGACSDNNMTTSLVVNDSDSEVSINRAGGKVEIPITADGSWTVSLDENTRWADVWTKEGKGEGKIVVNVDYLNPDRQIQERKSVITVQNGDYKQLITLRQYIGLKEGDTAPNADTLPYGDLWLSKGVGRGFDPITGKMTDAVLNARGMSDLAKANVEYATLFTQQTLPGFDGKVALCDTMETNRDSIGVAATIKVRYATFNLDLKVDYANSGDQKYQNTVYHATQDVSYLRSNASYTSVAGMLRSDPEFKNKETKQVVSTGFMYNYKDVLSAYEKDDDEELKDQVESMCEAYGPYVVTGATLGGSIFISMRTDSLAIQNAMDVSGKLAAEIMLAAIKIDGNVDVAYSKYGEDIWQKSSYYISLSGGDSQTYSNIAGLMMKEKPDLSLLKSAAKTWMQSIVSSDDSNDNTAVIDMSYTPIWNLFSNGKLKRKIKNIVVNYYQGKKLCSKLTLEDFSALGQ